MAIADYDPLYQPIRGKILGTVMQTGRNAPVIKSIDNNHGQQLRALQNSKAQLQHAATLWRQLTLADQVIWDAVRPDFPTVDRYGNPVLSSAYSLYLRAIAHLPNDRQVFLTSPGSPFSGPLPPDAQVANVGGVITFTSMNAPVGQNFDVSVFCTRYNPVSKDFPKPSFRRVLRLDAYTAVQTIDITGLIEQEFGPIDPGARVFWCVKTWKTGTPELVGSVCGYVQVGPPPPMPAITALTSISGVIVKSLWYDGADVPIMYINGVLQPAPTNPGANRWQYTMTFDGTPDQEIQIWADEKDRFSFPNSSLYFSSFNMGITYLDLSQLTGTQGTIQYFSQNPLFDVVLPDVGTPASVQWRILGSSISAFYAEYQAVSISGIGHYENLYITRFNRCALDISSLSIGNIFRLGDNGNTTSLSNSCYTVSMPPASVFDFSDFWLGTIYQPFTIDLSLYTGSFTGRFFLYNQGAGPKFYVLPPNLNQVTDMTIGNHRTMGNQLYVLDNTGFVCPLTTIYRNATTNAANRPEFDLTNWDMSNKMDVFTISDRCAQFVNLPVNNTHDFTWWRYEGLFTSNVAHLDLSGWTGQFSNIWRINSISNITQLTLPGDMTRVTDFWVSQLFQLGNFALTTPAFLDCVNFFIYRLDSGGTGSNRILDCSTGNFSGDFRIYSYADTRPQNWRWVVLPAVNTNNFRIIHFCNVGEQPVVDFSGWTRKSAR